MLCRNNRENFGRCLWFKVIPSFDDYDFDSDYELSWLNSSFTLERRPSVPDFYSAATNMEDQRDEVVQVIFPLSIFI